MPTVGWIWDRDNDNYYAAKSTVPDPGGEAPQVFTCPFCIATFNEPEQLREHLDATHTGQRPFMAVAGRELNSNEVIRSTINPESIELFNTSEISFSIDNLNYNTVSSDQLCKMLADMRHERLWLRLQHKFQPIAQFQPANGARQVWRGAAASVAAMQHASNNRKGSTPAPIQTDYDLSFRIYEDAVLEKVDELFVDILGHEHVRMDNVTEFIRKTQPYAAAEYRDALAQYVIAVLVKDADPETGVQATTLDYRAQFNGAMRILQQFTRPLAVLVTALIRFSSNNFKVAGNVDTGSDLLDAANAQLSRLTHSSKVWITPAGENPKRVLHQASCPIDIGSATVMWRAAQLADLSRWSPTLQLQLEAEAAVATLDPLDREKLYALWAHAAVRVNHMNEALFPLRELVGSYNFGQWAEELLLEINSE